MLSSMMKSLEVAKKKQLMLLHDRLDQRHGEVVALANFIAATEIQIDSICQQQQ